MGCRVQCVACDRFSMLGEMFIQWWWSVCWWSVCCLDVREGLLVTGSGSVCCLDVREGLLVTGSTSWLLSQYSPPAQSSCTGLRHLFENRPKECQNIWPYTIIWKARDPADRCSTIFIIFYQKLGCQVCTVCRLWRGHCQLYTSVKLSSTKLSDAKMSGANLSYI